MLLAVLRTDYHHGGLKYSFKVLFVGGTDNTSGVDSILTPSANGIFRPYSSTGLSEFGTTGVSPILGSLSDY